MGDPIRITAGYGTTNLLADTTQPFVAASLSLSNKKSNLSPVLDFSANVGSRDQKVRAEFGAQWKPNNRTELKAETYFEGMHTESFIATTGLADQTGAFKNCAPFVPTYSNFGGFGGSVSGKYNVTDKLSLQGGADFGMLSGCHDANKFDTVFSKGTSEFRRDYSKKVGEMVQNGSPIKDEPRNYGYRANIGAEYKISKRLSVFAEGGYNSFVKEPTFKAGLTLNL